MSAAPAPITVPGPLHPDLFDGQTPRRVPVTEPLRVYRVGVAFLVPKVRHQEVAATSETEAERIAVSITEDAEHEAIDAHLLDCAECPDRALEDQHLATWLDHREES